MTEFPLEVLRDIEATRRRVALDRITTRDLGALIEGRWVSTAERLRADMERREQDERHDS